MAEAIAEALMIPILTVRYESIIGSYLGETASRLSKLFEYAKTRECVLFFDEFETLGKERGDVHETGEIKRVVSSLLMQIDALPSYVIAIAATNHDNLLDKAAWRRFQIRLDIPKPTRSNLEEYYRFFEKERDFKFGLQPSTLAKKTLGISYAEAEEFALSIYRQYVLSLPNDNVKEITERAIRSWQSQVIIAHKKSGRSRNMPDRPLILFPSPERADREHKTPVFTKTVRPSFGRQFTRLQPSFNLLKNAFEQKALKLQQSPTGINPEFALVFEIIGTVDNFYTAVKNTDGLEWIFDSEVEPFDPDDDFYQVDKDSGERVDDSLNGKLYCVMSNQQAMPIIIIMAKTSKW